ncbi:MAG: hypothetical protein R6V50_06770 [Thermoplasmatota archaeon]
MNGDVFQRKDKTSTYCPKTINTKHKGNKVQIKKKFFTLCFACILIIVGLWLMSLPL